MGRQDISVLVASFREHYQDLLRFLVRRTGDPERAADLAQDTYLRLAAASPAAGEIRNARAYVYRVAGNLAIDALRRERRTASDLADAETGEGVPDPAPSAEVWTLDRERLRLLELALDELPRNAREALLLSRVEGCSFAEIADRLGVSQSMVAKYIVQALRHCRDRLHACDAGEWPGAK
ncbi:MAG: RNA polymerase sigma factor [Pseudomonadota bacterium]